MLQNCDQLNSLDFSKATWKTPGLICSLIFSRMHNKTDVCLSGRYWIHVCETQTYLTSLGKIVLKSWNYSSVEIFKWLRHTDSTNANNVGFCCSLPDQCSTLIVQLFPNVTLYLDLCFFFFFCFLNPLEDGVQEGESAQLWS